MVWTLPSENGTELFGSEMRFCDCHGRCMYWNCIPSCDGLGHRHCLSVYFYILFYLCLNGIFFCPLRDQSSHEGCYQVVLLFFEALFFCSISTALLSFSLLYR